MITQTQTEMFLQRMREMSAADLSVLAASVKTEGSSMATSPGSRNDALWTDMQKLGWLHSRNEEIDLPGGRHMTMKIYSVAPQGAEPISTLLSALTIK